MAKKRASNDASIGEADAEGYTSPQGKRIRLPLRTIPEIAKAMATVIREARAGRLDVADASRLSNCLSLLSRVLADGDLAARLEALEDRIKAGRS